jgi:hypothetical protein
MDAPDAAHISVAILAAINITVITSELSEVNMLSQKVQFMSSVLLCIVLANFLKYVLSENCCHCLIVLFLHSTV